MGLFGVIKSKNFVPPHFIGGVPLPKNNTSVVVTGLGALTPVGNDVPTTWRALVEGRSGIKRITRFDPSPFETQIAGEVKGFDPQEHFDRKEARRLDRFVQWLSGSSQGIPHI